MHVSGYFMLPKIRLELPLFLSQARERKARISFDPGWDANGFSGTTRMELIKLMSLVDFFEPNETELNAVAGKASVQESVNAISTQFNGVIALKLGKSGSRVFRDNDVIAEVPAFSVQVIDSTGAGDVFDAGFIHGMINGHTLEDSARMGNAAAAALISRNGIGLTRFPTVNEIRAATRTL